MARLQKANRVIDIPESQVESYLVRGYDLIDEDGTVLEAAKAGKNVPVAEYNAVVKELEDLKEQKTELPPAKAVDQEELERLKIEVKDLKEEVRVMEEENIRLDGELKKAKGQYNKK